MTDRIIKALENGRTVARGFWTDIDGYLSRYMDKDDTLNLTVDWSDWLGSDTIASATYHGNGLTVSGSTATPNTSATVSGVNATPAELLIQITTTTGIKKSMTLRFYEREH